MNVYLGARYTRKDEARALSEELTDHGYDMTSTWYFEPESPTVQLYDVDEKTLIEYARRDISEIDDAAVFILLSDPATSAHPRGGKHVEFGYALSKGKCVIVYGPIENIFHMLDGVVVRDTLDGLLQALSVTKLPAPGEELRVTDPVTGGQKGTKPCRMDLIPPQALWDLGLVYGMGAQKYDEYNWLRGYKWSLSIAALLRHLGKFLLGEYYDDESKLPHLAHVMWHCATLMEFSRLGRGTDDRQVTRASMTT